MIRVRMSDFAFHYLAKAVPAMLKYFSYLKCLWSNLANQMLAFIFSFSLYNFFLTSMVLYILTRCMCAKMKN